MNYLLTIRLSGVEGAVIRVLGLIERRGFRLDHCSVGMVDEGGRDMDVSVTSSRPGDLLKRQLERLHDVYRVEMKPAVRNDQTTPGIHPLKPGQSQGDNE